MPRLLTPSTGWFCAALLFAGSVTEYGADSYRYRISTVVGTSFDNFIGDGRPATSAILEKPSRIAVDSHGNLYIAEQSRRLRKVDVAGNISTLRGPVKPGWDDYYWTYKGIDAIAADRLGNLYVRNSVPGLADIWRVSPSGAFTPVEVKDESGRPVDNLGPHLAVDGAGNLYFTLYAPYWRILKMAQDGTVSTVVGTSVPAITNGESGQANTVKLMTVTGLAVDQEGNVYYIEQNVSCVHKVSTSGLVTTAAGDGLQGFAGDGGLATSARLTLPDGVAVDRGGTLYIAVDGRIRKVTKSGIISTVAGGGVGRDGGPASGAELLRPVAVAFDDAGNMYIAESYGHRVRKVSPDGTISTVAGSHTPEFIGDGGRAPAALLQGPVDVAANSAGELLIADSYVSATVPGPMRRVHRNGMISCVANAEVIQPPLVDPSLTEAHYCNFGVSGVAVDGSGSTYITQGDRVRKIHADGSTVTLADFSKDGERLISGQWNMPGRLTIDPTGNVYFSESISHRIRRISPKGEVTTVAGTGVRGFTGDDGPAVFAQLNEPHGLAIDSKGSLYVADTRNHKIRRISSAGLITTVAGTGANGFSGDEVAATRTQLNAPEGVAVDPAGNLYIADTGNHRIRKVDVSGQITTIAGKGDPGFGEGNGEAVAALLLKPSAVAVDINGNVYVADTGNRRIRKLTPVAP